MIRFLPLVFALAACLFIALPLVSEWSDRLVTRVAVALFGDYVSHEGSRKARQQRRLRAAYVGITHRAYAAKTLLQAGTIGVAGSIFGVYGVAALLVALQVSEARLREVLPAGVEFLAGVVRIPELGLVELFGVLLVASATVGAGLAGGHYVLRWQVLDHRAAARASEIETTLPLTIAFIYALSRSGMPFPKVLDTVARNDRTLGEAAAGLSVAVREMNTFGTDVLTALRRTANHTPSDDMAEFAENLAAVLGSGQNLSAFLEDQYRKYRDEAESQQQQYLELLGTFAEVYVTLLVAGPLFLVTLLAILGLVLENTIPILQVVTYAGIPLASAAFVVYLDSATGNVQGPDLDRRGGDESVGRERAVEIGDTPDATAADGGFEATSWRANERRLAAYDRFENARRALSNPLETVSNNPAYTFLFTLPVGVVWIAATRGPELLDRLRAAANDPVGSVSSADPTLVLATFDARLIEATLVVLAGYGLVYELRKRKIRSIERSVPDFLGRLSSINSAGTSLVGSFRRVAETDLGALTPDLKRLRRDLEWGADLETALDRLDRRVGSPLVSRSVVLITNAMRASSQIAPVLSIAADEARSTRALRRERRQVMLTYQIVIYISYLVFLGIVAALIVSFIPPIEEAVSEGATTGSETTGAVASAPGIIGVGAGDVPVDTYVRLFYHVSTIQAVCSGFIAGQLGEGSVRAGTKHAFVLLLIGHLAFVLLGIA